MTGGSIVNHYLNLFYRVNKHSKDQYHLFAIVVTNDKLKSPQLRGQYTLSHQDINVDTNAIRRS